MGRMWRGQNDIVVHVDDWSKNYRQVGFRNDGFIVLSKWFLNKKIYLGDFGKKVRRPFTNGILNWMWVMSNNTFCGPIWKIAQIFLAQKSTFQKMSKMLQKIQILTTNYEDCIHYKKAFLFHSKFSISLQRQNISIQELEYFLIKFSVHVD